MRKRSVTNLIQTGDAASANQERFSRRFAELTDECDVKSALVVVAFDDDNGMTDTTTLVNGCPACRVANLEVLLKHLRESCPDIDFPSPRPKNGARGVEHLH